MAELPMRERKEYMRGEERKMELKLIKENIWGKWRKRRENNMPRGKDEAEI